MTQVFISYSRKDLAFVERLAKDLKAAGPEVWYDLSGLEGGTRWVMGIQRAIDECQVFVVILSPNSVESEWVEKEFVYANSLNKKIIPLLYQPCKTPMWLINLHFIDVQGKNYDSHFWNILKAMGVKIPAIILPPVSTAKNAEQPKPVKVPWHSTNWGRGALLAGVIVLLLALTIWISELGHGKSPISNATTENPTGGTAVGLPAGLKTNLEGAQAEIIITANATPALPTSNLQPTLLPLTPETTFSTERQTQATKKVAQVFLRNGNSVFAAADWLTYSDDTSEWDLLTAIKLQDQQVIPFSEMKSLDLGEKLANDLSITVNLINGNVVAGKLDYGYANGSLKGLTNGRTINAPFKDIRRIDFQPGASESIEFTVATIVNSNGEEILTPTDLLEACYSSSGFAGPYTYSRGAWVIEMGVDVPLQLMQGFEIQKEDSSSNIAYTMVYTLLDGRTLTNKLEMSESPYLRGMTELGAFRLNLSDIKWVDFHRTNAHVLPLLTVEATLTLQDGTIYEVPASLLAYTTYYWIPSFPFPHYQNIYFNEIKSLTIQPGEDSTNATITADLLSKQTLTGQMQITDDDRFVGIDNSGKFVDVALEDLKSIVFSQSSTATPEGQMAIVIDTDGNQIQSPVNSVRLHISHSSMAGPWDSYDNELSLTTGLTFPFSKIKKIEVGKYDSDVNHYPATITMVDGQILKSFFSDSVHSNSQICGLTPMGPFALNFSKVISLEFNRKDTLPASAQSTTASVSLNNGSKFQIPVKWLVYNQWSWAASLPVSPSQSIPFNELKSIKVEADAKNFAFVSVTITTLDGEVIENSKMELQGNGELIGIDMNGALVDAQFRDVKQIEFGTGALLAIQITKALVITREGDQLQVPANSLKILIGSVGMAGYMRGTYDEISLTSGIKVPLNKITKFEIGVYDSTVKHNPISITTTSGQVINSFIDNNSGQDFAICGLTENGPFTLDINEIESVNTGR